LTNSKLLNYGRHLIEQDDIDEVVAILQSDLITQGPMVEQFESAIAKQVGAKFAIAITSGTAGLHIACLAAGINSNSYGLTSAMTFVASANAMIYCGAEVGLCDIDPNTLGISPQSLKNSLIARPDTEIIIPVHFAGLAAHSKDIRKISGDRIIVEDAAHAFGAKYPCGRPVGCGAYADMTVFSFHPVKPITTGEGGAVVTNDPKLAHRLRTLRTHGIERSSDFLKCEELSFENGIKNPWYYEQQHLGFNYRMTDIQAALGNSQLKKLDRFTERRRFIANQYNTAFSELKNVSRPQLKTDYLNRSGHHLYVLNFDLKKLNTTRTKIFYQLADQNIGSQVHYIPVYRQPYHTKRIVQTANDFPETENYYQGCLSLPIYPGMTNQDISSVIKAVLFISKN
jgi:UDP-4-amino-4,6-dideoxy-N-acetyl-beta-L-altrosamine transaminase